MTPDKADNPIAEADDTRAEKRCVACGGRLEAGAIRARNTEAGVSGIPELGMVVSSFTFVRPGTPTSANPVTAFLQGLREEPGERLLPLEAFRCTECGRVEMFAAEAEYSTR
jgi:hypothetical protein